MRECQLVFDDNVNFNNRLDLLIHLSRQLQQKGIVKESHLKALIDREASFPTGILLDGYAVAIPHCGAEHANSPAIFILRTQSPVLFQRADDDGTVDVSLIISLVVTSPADQLTLLKTLFTNLQDKEFYHFLLNSPQDEIAKHFNEIIFNQ
ncbi:PTS galactitol transporter subunit IIA [Gilliamella sp. Pra-s65]|uniref:PTS galactitol transporter subunit IIA n=1 Tax=unclassified Gilliamella TaxID=2685620 RepID=UPI00136526A0|nr:MULTISPECIES: PTS galactitol transporter subunit IIA [unclassified Gilliamella]MWN90906.1 PTS galactitol transporter subunit IIA [Gilliamella sp. Pra-s65]MWP73845.1 PTS galactitol transporter subunit IIA [Gilliamella sp. Pra-s52]